MMEIENNQPPVLITPEARPPVVIELAPSVVIEPPAENFLLITQVPGVGPQGEQGPAGSSGVGAVDHEARDMIALHLVDPTPHPPYDDMPSLTLIFENGLI